MELEKNRDEKFGFVTRYRAIFCFLLSGVLRREKVLQSPFLAEVVLIL